MILLIFCVSDKQEICVYPCILLVMKPSSCHLLLFLSYLKVKMFLVQFVVCSFQEITSMVGSKLTDLKIVQ